jgi:hypothetical protein
MELPEFEPFQDDALLVRALVQERVAFVIVGGTAHCLHGCRTREKVNDLDLQIDRERKNLARLHAALEQIPVRDIPTVDELAKPTPRGRLLRISQHPQPGGEAYLTPCSIQADLLFGAPDFDYASFASRALPALVAGLDVLFASAADCLDRMDAALAGRHPKTDQFSADARCLRLRVGGV